MAKQEDLILCDYCTLRRRRRNSFTFSTKILDQGTSIIGMATAADDKEVPGSSIIVHHLFK